jgi:hypothetical protein
MSFEKLHTRTSFHEGGLYFSQKRHDGSHISCGGIGEESIVSLPIVDFGDKISLAQAMGA